jgi:hypothetical protein
MYRASIDPHGYAGQAKGTASTLHVWLQVLATESRAEEREAAARALFEHVKRWAPRYLSRVFQSLLRDLGDHPSDLIEDAIQHLLTTASVGRSKFRGTSDAAAMSWCKVVLRNHLTTELHRKARHTRDVEMVDLPVDSPASTSVSPGAICDLALAVRAELLRTRRMRDALSLFAAFCSFLEHRLGTAAVALIPRPGAEPRSSPARKGDVGDRIRKQRQRGREAAEAVLVDLRNNARCPLLQGQLAILLQTEPVVQRSRVA